MEINHSACHCDKPCEINWIDLPLGTHDIASTDTNGKDHCSNCDELVGAYSAQEYMNDYYDQLLREEMWKGSNE